MNNNYYFDLHQDIITRQGKTCPKCTRSLVFADNLTVVDGSMYCGKCGDLESKKAEVKRSLFGSDAKKRALIRARADYDRVRKSDK